MKSDEVPDKELAIFSSDTFFGICLNQSRDTNLMLSRNGGSEIMSHLK